MSIRIGGRAVSGRLAATAFLLLLGVGVLTVMATASPAAPRVNGNGLIAFLHASAKGRELYVVRADGTHGRRLAGANVRMFVWSHGGKKIAYLRGRPDSTTRTSM